MRLYFLEMLARRLELDVPPQREDSDVASGLERQFERAVGMLFGFESVRLAMMSDPIPARVRCASAEPRYLCLSSMCQWKQSPCTSRKSASTCGADV